MALMDPAAQLPERLQKRLDSWKYNPRKWQHQAYGPLNAYFSLKFPPTHFLVKPQALLRKEVPPDDSDADRSDNDNSDDDDDVDQTFDSIDSHGWYWTPVQRCFTLTGCKRCCGYESEALPRLQHRSVLGC